MKSMLKGFYIYTHTKIRTSGYEFCVYVAPCMWILSLMRITYSSPPCYQLYNSICVTGDGGGGECAPITAQRSRAQVSRALLH